MSTSDDFASDLGRLMQLDVDIRVWEERLSGRPEARLLSYARRELGFAQYAASCGLYVHAYAGLRVFLELSFASVYFSANELYRRRWMADRQDFSWSKALDENDGVLSLNFVREFSEAASADAATYARTAAESYRHCSDFIHGKVAATSQLPDTLGYASDVIRGWIATGIKSATAVIFLLYARYGDELLGDDDGRLAGTLEYSFSVLPTIRTRLGLPVEEGRARAR
jgi:hypothetical protein